MASPYAQADQLNNQLEAEIRPVLEQLCATLHLGGETQTVRGTRVVVISPYAVKPNRTRVAGVFAGARFALLTGNDYNAYRIAHARGIIG